MIALLRALSVGRCAVVVAAGAGATFLMGALLPSGRSTSIDADLGLPALVTGGLLLTAAYLTWAIGDAPRTAARDRRRWRWLAVGLAAIGAERTTSLHERIADWTDTALGLAALPAAAVGLIELTVGAVAVIVALAALQRRHGPLRAEDPSAGVALHRMLRSVDARRLGLGLATAIAFLLAAGILYHAGTVPLDSFDLRSEQGLQEFLSVALLAAAAGLAHFAGRLLGDPWHAWPLLAAVLAFMALDDLIAIHEEIGYATVDGRGQLFMLPVVAVAGAAWLSCLHASRGPVRALLAGGGVAWFASQAIDLLQPAGQWHWTIVPEEGLELTGSALFVVGLLLVAQRYAATPAMSARDGTGSPVAAGDAGAGTGL